MNILFKQEKDEETKTLNKLSIDYIVGISNKNNYIPSDGYIDKIVVGKTN